MLHHCVVGGPSAEENRFVMGSGLGGLFAEEARLTICLEPAI